MNQNHHTVSAAPSPVRDALGRHLFRSSLLVLVLFGMNKVTGFVKLLLTTRAFGTGPAADALAAANQFPELLQMMLVGGALGAALIPVYSAYLTAQELGKARALANTIFTLALLLIVSVCGVAALCTPWLARALLVPDFSPSQQALTADLMRILMIATVLLSVASVFTSLLNAHQHFFAPALGTVFIDLGQIVGLYFLAPTWGVYGAAWGSVLGAILLGFVQVPALWQQRIRLRLQLALRLAGTREVLQLMGPRIMILMLAQAVDLVVIRLASGLPAGSIAALFYALLVMVAMPASFFGAAISTVFFPTMSAQFNRGELADLKSTASQALRVTWGLVVPAAVGLIALGEPGMAFLFQRGSFDAEATTLVYTLAVILSIRLIADVSHGILVLPFFAHHNTRVPMWVGVGWTIVHVSLSIVLVRPLGILGLAWASSLAAAAQAVVLYLLNVRILDGLDEGQLGQDILRILVACVVMLVVVTTIQRLELSLLPYLLTAITLGGLSYAGTYILVGGQRS